MASAPLPSTELSTFLAAHPQWSVVDGALVATFEARTFMAAIDYVREVARLAEAADHHPDIDIRYRKVTLRLITHDAGNAITALDTRLAKEASMLFSALS